MLFRQIPCSGHVGDTCVVMLLSLPPCSRVSRRGAGRKGKEEVACACKRRGGKGFVVACYLNSVGACVCSWKARKSHNESRRLRAGLWWLEPLGIKTSSWRFGGCETGKGSSMPLHMPLVTVLRRVDDRACRASRMARCPFLSLCCTESVIDARCTLDLVAGTRRSTVLARRCTAGRRLHVSIWEGSGLRARTGPETTAPAIVWCCWQPG